jgi:hypothetical protein
MKFYTTENHDKIELPVTLLEVLMNYVIGILLEIFKFLKEKGHIEEFLTWCDEQADKTDSPIDDAFIKVLRFFVG